MFPLADIRGRVLGFGARAMREEQRPKYLNTSDNDVYHKGLHLYGADLARAHAAKAGEVILCEGYTDTIALHQAGMRNAVGLMGTALTGEQVGELARMAQTVLLALDADSAGQEAMLRAYSLANKRRLKLRVVALPAGDDPADVVQVNGPEAMQAAIDRSLEFARFRVERVLASGDTSDTEVQDRMLEELRPVFSELPPRSAMRVELTELVSNRFAVRTNLVETRLAEVATTRQSAPEARSANGGHVRSGLSRQADTERAFLALCIAVPEEGTAALDVVDVEEHFSSDLLRRAARHLAGGGLRDPMSAPGLDEDPELKALLAELVVEAGREGSDPGMLEIQRLQLELARVERSIQQARGKEDAGVEEMARRRAELKVQFDRVYTEVLDRTGEREG